MLTNTDSDELKVHDRWSVFVGLLSAPIEDVACDITTYQQLFCRNRPSALVLFNCNKTRQSFPLSQTRTDSLEG
jgi:hypothetical protein